MPKSRGRKPKKKRAPASAPKKRLDNLNATPQELPLSTQPPQEPPPLATAPRQEQSTPKIKQIAKLTTAVVVAAIGIVLCAYVFSVNGGPGLGTWLMRKPDWHRPDGFCSYFNPRRRPQPSAQPSLRRLSRTACPACSGIAMSA